MAVHKGKLNPRAAKGKLGHGYQNCSNHHDDCNMHQAEGRLAQGNPVHEDRLGLV